MSAYKVQTPGNYPEESIQQNITCLLCYHFTAFTSYCSGFKYTVVVNLSYLFSEGLLNIDVTCHVEPNIPFPIHCNTHQPQNLPLTVLKSVPCVAVIVVLWKCIT